MALFIKPSVYTTSRMARWSGNDITILIITTIDVLVFWPKYIAYCWQAAVIFEEKMKTATTRLGRHRNGFHFILIDGTPALFTDLTLAHINIQHRYAGNLARNNGDPAQRFTINRKPLVNFCR